MNLTDSQFEDYYFANKIVHIPINFYAIKEILYEITRNFYVYHFTGSKTAWSGKQKYFMDLNYFKLKCILFHSLVA